ncbi:hypothetical protein Tco_0230991 [Tanacetum coccineum]
MTSARNRWRDHVMCAPHRGGELHKLVVGLQKAGLHLNVFSPEARYHFIKEQVKRVLLNYSLIGTEYQLADCLLKLYQKIGFYYLVRRTGMRCFDLGEWRAQVDQGSQIRMIQVKEMMQDNDLKNSKSKDKGSKSRSQIMDKQSHYKEDKTITRQSINVKRHILNAIGGDKLESRSLTLLSSK